MKGGEDPETPEARRVLVLKGSRHAQILASAAGAGLAVATVSEGQGPGGSDMTASLCIVDLDGNGERMSALIERMREQGIPVLVIAESVDPTLDLVLQNGATHYLPAPFSDADLVRAVRLAQASARTKNGLRERRVIPPLQVPVEDETAVRARIEARLKASPLPLGLLLIAFTRMEMINTAFGRDIGDTLLEAAAGRIAPLLKLPDGQAVLSRLDGASFAVTLDGLEASARMQLAERIVERIERPFFAERHMVTMACRIGVVESMASDDATSLLKRAGAALAEARAPESAPVRMLSVADEGAALFDASLETDLRQALDRGEIEILFQPQLSVTSEDVVGVEALARWQHPQHGELGADTLFAVAERSDYLAALSAHVQQRASQIAAAWSPVLDHLRLAINLTASDIARPGFVETFFKMVDASGLARGRLTVEITETGLMHDLSAAALVLAGLRAGGCRVAIDDFGTGYSSLAYLKALPLDYLKIDKRLASDITGSSRDRIVVRGVIDMARSLGLAVIAEGVETREQLALLAAEGCNYYQGFLFAGAVTSEELARLVRP